MWVTLKINKKHLILYSLSDGRSDIIIYISGVDLEGDNGFNHLPRIKKKITIKIIVSGDRLLV